MVNTTTFGGYLLAKEGYFAKYQPPERTAILKGHMDEQGFWTSSHSNVHVLIYNARLVGKKTLPRRILTFWTPSGKPSWE